MSESFWQKPNESLSLPKGTIYAQTFSPLWSHTLDEIRVYIKHTKYPAKVKVSVKFLDLDGTPAGLDLSNFIFSWEHIPYGAFTSVRQPKMPPIYLVHGINYAFLIETLDCSPMYKPSTLYQPAPSGYPRGKLIVSTDGGHTWDTTDLGDLLFSEFGDPPRTPVPYSPPFDHWGITDYASIDYNTNSCIRFASSSPTTATLMLAVEKPQPIEIGITTRGVTTMCLDHYTFKAARAYHQLEKNDSIYHTFFVTKLKAAEKYWFAFIADANFSPTLSVSPIFEKIHPGGPSFTTIRRPDAPGDECSPDLDGNGKPCPLHYQTVNEASPDDEASELKGATPHSEWGYDLYNIPDLAPPSRPIKEVHITARVKREGYYTGVAIVRFHIKTHGSEHTKTITTDIPRHYVNAHWHLKLNPDTGLAWTYQEVIDLQIGIGLRKMSAVGSSATGYCTQLFCKIIHDCSAYE